MRKLPSPPQNCNLMSDESDWTQVDEYAKRRRADRGDVFGWFRRPNEENVAVILAADSTEDESFPEEISGIRLTVKKISAPEKQS